MFLGGKGRLACKPDILTDICEPKFWKKWDPRRLTTLWASTACYWDSFPFIIIIIAGASTSHNPMDLEGLLQEYIYLYHYHYYYY
jgi:hypothetical protein